MHFVAGIRSMSWNLLHGLWDSSCNPCWATVASSTGSPASGVLEGITRQTVLDLAAKQGISARQQGFDAERLKNAAEVFITSTAGGVMPVTAVNGFSIGDGKPGKITTLLQNRYWEAHDEDRWTTAVQYSADYA